MQAQDKAYRAIPLVLATIDDVAEYNNDQPRVLGLVVTLTAHTRIEEEVAGAIREDYPEWTFETTIPRLIEYAEDSRWGMPIGAYRPNGKGAAAYRDLAAEVLARINGRACYSLREFAKLEADGVDRVDDRQNDLLCDIEWSAELCLRNRHP